MFKQRTSCQVNTAYKNILLSRLYAAFAVSRQRNIITFANATEKYSYEYDEANQLIRENLYYGSGNANNATYTYAYDDWGNILTKSAYAYTAATTLPGAALDTVIYGYSNSDWGDMLSHITIGNRSYQHFYDEMGNPTSYLGVTLAWEGKQLVSHSTGGSGGKAILTTFAYDENGLRTQKTYNGTTTNYYYNGSVLMGMVTGTGTTAIHQLFSYDSSGNVVSVDYSSNGGNTFTTYYYVRNAQNDVVKLINGSGTTVVEYTYDTWGKLLATTGSLATTLGANQPFRYRGYVYDTETGWYYLQSRYYDPSIGRFISADVFLSTGQGVLGHNAFAYCLNNPINFYDSTGTYGQSFRSWNETWTDDEIAGGVRKPDKYYRPWLMYDAYGNIIARQKRIDAFFQQMMEHFQEEKALEELLELQTLIEQYIDIKLKELLRDVCGFFVMLVYIGMPILAFIEVVIDAYAPPEGLISLGLDIVAIGTMGLPISSGLSSAIVLAGLTLCIVGTIWQAIEDPFWR